MVHALHEAHRVLKPNQLLIDLRPTATHRRIGVGHGERWQFAGAMRERFDDDRAADRAAVQVVKEGFFRRGRKLVFEVERVMDTMTDFREWLDDFVQSESLPSHEWLLKRVERIRGKTDPNAKITVRGPLRLNVLKKRHI
jgi:hypothetical protein